MSLGQLELYSYTALLLGQRQLLLSLLGFLLVLACCRLWRRHSSASVLAPWLFFLSWLVWAPLVFTPERLQGFQAPIRETWSTIAPADVFTLCSQSIVHRFRSPPLTALPQLTWTLMVIIGWALFAVWRLFRLWRKRRRFVLIAARASPLDDAVSSAMLARWRQAFGLRRHVALRTSDLCPQAFTIGLLRPVIHIPGTLVRGLTANELDAVIGHEMAHVKRCDDLVIRVQRVLRALFFFNPLIAIAGRRVAELREQCCDRLAMERGNLSVRQYGGSLLRSLSLNQGKEQCQDDVAALNSTALRRRIESLTHARRVFSPAPLLTTALLLATLSLLFGHTGSDPMSADESALVLARLGAVAPAPGQQVLSKPFLWPKECVLGAIQQDSYHPGVDFTTPVGRTTPIHVLAPGRVTHVFERASFSKIAPSGWQVHVQHHNGVVSTYLHLDDVLVRPGDRLARGDIIANNTGRHHGHVHVEVHQRGRVLDPSYLLTLAH